MTLIDQLAAELSVPSDTLRASLLASESAEAAVPNYLTVDPVTHLVGANFTGSVQLREATSNAFSPSHAVQWSDSSGAQEFIQGFGGAGAHALFMSTGAPNFDTNLQLVSNPPANIIKVAAQAHNATVDILDSLGRSGFLQLPGTQKLELASGVSGTTAGVGGWNTVNIATNTGFTSYLYLYSVVPTASLTVVSHAINSANTTAAQLSIDVNLNAPTNVHFYWAAIGS